MKDTIKTAGKSIIGATTALLGSNLPGWVGSLEHAASAICSVLSVVIAVITVIYIYYKMRNERFECERNKKE
jgi:ABC-type uncharacterized transport system permease subunit